MLKRCFRKKLRISKRISVKSIEARPVEANGINPFFHWEADTILGRKGSDEPAVFTQVKRLTGCCVFFRANGKSAPDIMHTMKGFNRRYGENFHLVVRSITSDNGCEFADFASLETWGNERLI